MTLLARGSKMQLQQVILKENMRLLGNQKTFNTTDAAGPLLVNSMHIDGQFLHIDHPRFGSSIIHISNILEGRLLSVQAVVRNELVNVAEQAANAEAAALYADAAPKPAPRRRKASASL